MNVVTREAITADQHGALCAIRWQDEVWTNASLYQYACHSAAAMLDQGFQPGDRVAIALSNSPELYALSSATWIAGGIVCILDNDPAAQRDVVRQCEPKFLFVDHDECVAAGPRNVPHVISVAGSRRAQFRSQVLGMEPVAAPLAVPGSAVAQICFTSGTTGTPKGVVFTHSAIAAFWDAHSFPFSGRRPRQIVLNCLPATAFGSRLVGLRAATNSEYVLFSQIRAIGILEAIEQYAVTDLPLVPAMMEEIASLRPGRLFEISSLRNVRVGGARVSKNLIERFRIQVSQISAPNSTKSKSTKHPGTVRPRINIFISYGTTEAGGACAGTATDGDDVVGAIAPGTEVRIVDGSGAELPPGSIGEILVRTPYSGAGYWGEHTATAHVFRDGFVRTGDVGRINSDNKLCVIGRENEVIIQGGQNVHPEEVANVIRSVDGVVDCAAVGIEDEFLGEAVAACVVRKAFDSVTEATIRRECRRRLNRRKVPPHVLFLEDLPRTKTGKLDVRELRERARLRLCLPEKAVGTDLDHRRLGDRAALAETIGLAVRDVLHGVGSEADLDRLNEEATFWEVGIDSIGVVEVAHKLSLALGRRIRPAQLFANPTLSSLTAALYEAGGPSVSSTKVHKRPRVDRGAEPVAIFGIGCRLPGGIRGPDRYWQALCLGQDAVSSPPKGRFGPSLKGWRASFLSNVFGFDAEFFGLAADNTTMDPRQRIFLEVSWEALEDSGLKPYDLSGKPVGVFLGIFGNSYPTPDPLGASLGMTVSRICHHLNFRGPALSLDTTCSSSLVATALAVESLRRRECDIAIAGGVSILSGDSHSRSGGLVAPDGRSKAFDAGADGFGQGEGCVIVALKRASDIDPRREREYACIRGVAVNHDGRSATLTAPNPGAQSALIRMALEQAGVTPNAVQYVEAHGTGTVLGDPIEIEGLTEVFAGRRMAPLRVGSVKTNIGHLEAAAGSAGLAKAALSVYHRYLPQSLHFVEPNSHVPWAEIPIRVQSVNSDWPDPENELICGVSSFGLSGTNAHVVLGEGEGRTIRESRDNGSAALLPISARTPASLRRQIRRYVRFLEDTQSSTRILDIGYTASRGRTHFPYRVAVAGSNGGEWVSELRKAIDEFAIEDGAKDRHVPRKLALVFAGQGPQWWGMAHALLREEAIFAETVKTCAGHVASYADWDLVEELGRSESTARIDQPEFAQPALCAFQLGVLEVLRSWGVTYDCVIGHSLGELAAAYAAGGISLQDAMFIANARGRVMRDVVGTGRLMHIGANADDVTRWVEESNLGIDIAARNSPVATTVAGGVNELSRFAEALGANGQDVKWLPGNIPFHSRHLKPASAELHRILESRIPACSSHGMISTALATQEPVLDAAYWAHQMRSPVLFHSAIRLAAHRGCTAYLEIGPHPVLGAAILESASTEAGRKAVVVTAQKREEGGRKGLLNALGALYCSGYEIDWSRHYPDGCIVSIPTYAWQHREARIEHRAHTDARQISIAGRQYRHADGASHTQDIVLATVDWQAVAHPQQRKANGTWLLLGTSGALATSLASEFTLRGAKAVCLNSVASEPSRAEQCDGDEFMRRVSGELRERQFAGVVDLRCAEMHESPNSIGAAVLQSTMEALSLVQSVLSAGARLPALSIVTRGAQPVNGYSGGLIQAPLWGLGLSIQKEYEDLRLKMVDIGPEGERMDLVCTELLTDDEERRVAYRRGHRYVARFRHHLPGADHSRRVDPERSYLVTGAFGGLGIEVARWLVRSGAKNLILLGRRTPSPNIESELAEHSAAGVRVFVGSCDIGDREKLGDVMRHAAKNMPRVAGVLHCAGLIDDATVRKLDQRAVESVMRTKVDGSWNLHLLTDSLDFFIMFSSVAATFGNGGQANYSAANAFMDVLATYRKAIGLPAQSIAWGGWKVGMATRLARSPGTGIDAASGLAALGRLVGDPVSHVLAVSGMDFEAFARSKGVDRQFLSYLANNSRASADGEDLRVNSSLPRPASQGKAQKLEALLIRLIAASANVSPGEIQNSDTLEKLGIDSLTVLKIRSRILSSGIDCSTQDIELSMTIGQLRRTISGDRPLQGDSARPLIPLFQDGKSPVIAFFHPVGGGVDCYRPLANVLARSAIAIEAGALRRSVAFRSRGIEELAADYCRLLESSTNALPTCLVGWSFGGLLALETARILQQRGASAPLVVMIDSHLAPDQLGTTVLRPSAQIVGEDVKMAGERVVDLPVHETQLVERYAIVRFLKDIAFQQDALLDLTELEAFKCDPAKIADDSALSRIFVQARDSGLLCDVAIDDAVRMFSVFFENVRALRYYCPSPYGGRVLNISASRSQEVDASAWSRVLPGMTRFIIDAEHYSIMKDDSAIAQIAVAINSELAFRVSEGHANPGSRRSPLANATANVAVERASDLGLP